MSATVIVPSYRRPDDLRRCLEALAAQERMPDEVILVGRTEDAETWRVADDAPEALALNQIKVDQTGVVFALNTAFDAARGDVVAITDDDSVPFPDWLRRIEAAFGADRRLGAVGGRDVVHDEAGTGIGAEPTVGMIRRYGRVIGHHALGTGPPRRVDLLKGVNMAVRGEALRGVRIDDGLRGSGAQPHWEIDLCLALAARGWEILYDPAILVDHYPAQRFDEDQRVGRSLRALYNDVYNETFALLSRSTRRRATATFAYGVLVGTRHAPGVITALEQRVRGRPVRAHLRSTSAARFRAFRDICG